MSQILVCLLRGAGQAQLESFHEKTHLPGLKRTRLILAAHHLAVRMRGFPLSVGEELGL